MTIFARFAPMALAALLLAGGLRAQEPGGASSGSSALLAAAPANSAVAVAQQGASASTQANGMIRGYGMSWREAWSYGGFIMWIILALSIFGGALVLYSLAVLRPAQVAPRYLMNELIDRISADDLNAARRACETRACALGSITLTALDYLRSASHSDINLLRDMVESEGARQSEEMQSQTQLLLDVAVIAPMLGLLGTVLGMLKAFGSVAHDVAAAKPIILAQGVSQAIVTTIFGLMVAIPAMIFYSYFRRRASRVVSLLESAATEILTALAAREQQ